MDKKIDAKTIAAEAYQVIGVLAYGHKDCDRALDYFSAVANGDRPDSILPFVDSENVD